MYVENANRALKEGLITVDNQEPNPKNPIIAAFFRNIGYADQLGSGVRKLFKYSKFYSGKEPEFVEGDIFRIFVPLDDTYSFDYGQTNGINISRNDTNDTISDTNEHDTLENKLLSLIKQNAEWTQKQYALQMQVSLPTVKRVLAKLQREHIVVREGNNRKGKWIINIYKNDEM